MLRLPVATRGTPRGHVRGRRVIRTAMHYLAKLFIVISFSLAPVGVFGAQVLPDLLDLVQQRTVIAGALVIPATECFQRSDTEHPVFRGCVDWHLAVHAAWTILAYTRLTGDQRYLRLVPEVSSIDGLHQELTFLRSHPAFEMPYGRAWFLRFAIEHKRQFGESVVQEIAQHVKESLLVYYRTNPPLPQSRNYDSASWALINLLDYAHETNDVSTISEVRDMVRARFMQPEQSCDTSRERGAFMAVCTTWAWLVSKVESRESFLYWYKSWGANLEGLQPVSNPATAHEYGLNFSRAWGLWRIFAVTSQPSILSAYTKHFNATYLRPTHWKGDYRTVGHWVAQFGMFAALPLFELPE